MKIIINKDTLTDEKLKKILQNFAVIHIKDGTIIVDDSASLGEQKTLIELLQELNVEIREIK